jgi:hypothetical protein
MQAIQTKFIGPTNRLGARVSAKAQAGRIIVPWDHHLSPDNNHKVAAVMFAQKFEWKGELVGGGLPDGSMVWVFTASLSPRGVS